MNELEDPNKEKGNIVKEVLTGFGVTILCNLAGMYFYVSIFFDLDSWEAIKWTYVNGYFSSVVGLGALLDFLAFFVFLKKEQYYRVRGVLMGVILAALVVLLYMIFGPSRNLF